MLDNASWDNASRNGEDSGYIRKQAAHAGGLAAWRVKNTYKVHSAFGEDRKREDAL